MKIGIIGATVYGGAELVRYLHKHPDVSIHSIHATSLHGEPLSNSYKHMEGIIPHTLSEVDVEHISKEVDLVFTATPSGVASKLAPQSIERGVKVIDLSEDFRIKSQAEYEEWYRIDARNQALVHEAVYRLAAWTAAALSEPQLIFNPRSLPTAILLRLAL